MILELTPEQARIIGVLLEKESTTPEQYPLSLNALTLGCNQKSNREPVMELTETEVQQGLDELQQKKAIFCLNNPGSRVSKYKHRFCNTEFSDLQLSDEQRAVLCVLLLRGAQTPGELRTRTQRLADFDDVEQVEQCLRSLQDYKGNALVMKLAREPGKRESRYAQLFCQEHGLQAASKDDGDDQRISTASNTQSLASRVSELENQVAALYDELHVMRAILERLPHP
ncbi:MAG: DUF480 domain-containing protein [Paraglaciecola sp.]|nr:DUF480 domain-containing protein [Paraglaciecola sp.]NCT46853.1 DUF480 domain-containing protein [Paraglaciecola sp.]